MKPLKGIATVGIALCTLSGLTSVAWAETSNTTSNTTTQNGTPTNNTVTESVYGSDNTNVNSALPDSYLYFVQQVTQAISVSLASTDVQKAQLLAQYGELEIEQANQLLQSGQADAANTLLQTALTDQTLAVDTANTASQSGSASASDVSSITGMVSGNLTGLSTALQNVSNPKAQAALEKNVAKAFAHLQMRLAHIGKESTQDVALSTLTSELTALGNGENQINMQTANSTNAAGTSVPEDTTPQESVAQGHGKGSHVKDQGKHSGGIFGDVTNAPNLAVNSVTNTTESASTNTTVNSLTNTSSHISGSDVTVSTNASVKGEAQSQNGMSHANSRHGGDSAESGHGQGKH